MLHFRDYSNKYFFYIDLQTLMKSAETGPSVAI
jgi:hypothetical protein